MRAMSTQPVSSQTSSIARTSSSLVRLKLTPAAHPLVDVVVDASVAVSEDDRAVAHAQVDELVAVQVPDEPTLAAIDVDRVVAPRPEVRVGAAGHVLQRAPIELVLAVSRDRRGRVGDGLGGHEGPLRAGWGDPVRGTGVAWSGTGDAHRAIWASAASTRHSSANGHTPCESRTPSVKRRDVMRVIPPGGFHARGWHHAPDAHTRWTDQLLAPRAGGPRGDHRRCRARRRAVDVGDRRAPGSPGSGPRSP